MSTVRRYATPGAVAVVTVMSVVTVYLLYRLVIYQREMTETQRYEHSLRLQRLREQTKAPGSGGSGEAVVEDTTEDEDDEEAEEGN